MIIFIVDNTKKKQINTLMMECVNALYEFRLDKLVLNSFVDQNRSVFEELADSMNELYGMNRDVQNRSRTNYESLRRNKRRLR